MKLSTLRDMVLGMALGAAACVGYSMIDPHAQKKLRKMAQRIMPS